MKWLTGFLLCFFYTAIGTVAQSPAARYAEVQKRLQNGWNTFNHKSVLSHVLLPEGFAMNIGFKLHSGPAMNYLKEAYISSRDDRPEKIHPYDHAFDGSYTELDIEWEGLKCKVQSAADENNNLILLITPIRVPENIPSIVLETGILWNKPGNVTTYPGGIKIASKKKSIHISAIGNASREYLANTSAYLSLSLDKTVAFYTGTKKTMDQIISSVAQKKLSVARESMRYDSLSATFAAMRNVIAWNVIYDASRDRVIFPVSRLWNESFGGQSVLFDWDTYFAAYMASTGSKDLAYANAIEITKSITPGGFIPNFAGSYYSASNDRSQPPVGSFVFKELYRKFGDLWVLEYVFDELLTWNRWWPEHRDDDGFLCWGSEKVSSPVASDAAQHTWQGAAYESGLDNSPMYDDLVFNQEKNMLPLADVGLMSFYILDCESLAAIARILKKETVYTELMERAERYKNKLSLLWSDKQQIFLNRRTDTHVFSERMSPTNFYPLFTSVPTAEQAALMVNNHLLNPEEFAGEWIIPSISRKDPAFPQQEYWRGRIWAPMNFLVYLGLKKQNLKDAARMLADKSNDLFIQNVKLNGWVFENYNAITGNVTDQREGRHFGDNYYHWGALLGFTSLIEYKFVSSPFDALE